MENLHNRLNPQNLEHFFVLEGGGPFGIGYEAGILDEFRERGADGHGIHSLGTSAGSWVGAMMATGKTFDDVANKKQIELFNQKPNYMLEYAREIFGDARSPYVNATASRLRPGKPQLEIWNGGEHDLADMATMSSSVPGLFFPAIYNNNLYWDGAVAGVSAGYAHMAPQAETLVVIGALAKHIKVPLPLGPLQGVPGWVLEQKSRRDWGRWKKQNPESNVVYIRPNRAISALIKKPGDLFDFEIAKEAYWMAREQSAQLIETRESVGQLAARLCVKPLSLVQ
jgi:predicted acylesterase/phospholipase RssA